MIPYKDWQRDNPDWPKFKRDLLDSRLVTVAQLRNKKGQVIPKGVEVQILVRGRSGLDVIWGIGGNQVLICQVGYHKLRPIT